ncbi:hypothetical protein ACFX13_022192 [Malus domestica]
MATQENLVYLGVEASAMIDKYYGRPAGRDPTRPPFTQDPHKPAHQYHHQQASGDQPVLTSKDAALLFGGIEIREYSRSRR